MTETKKHYVGVDPGQKGAITVVDSDGFIVGVEVMPGGVAAIASCMRRIAGVHLRPVVVIERAQPMPRQGVSSSFNYGRHFGMFEAAAFLLGMPYHEVSPVVWKKAMGVTADKATSIIECKRIWPTVELVMPGCRKEHDGIAEALLVAEWGRRKGL